MKPSRLIHIFDLFDGVLSEAGLAPMDLIIIEEIGNCVVIEIYGRGKIHAQRFMRGSVELPERLSRA